MAAPARHPTPRTADPQLMHLSQHYRSYGLPWEVDPAEQQRLRRLLAAGLLAVLLFGVILPFMHLPPVIEASSDTVPERLARLMVQQHPKPPPPVVQPKPQPKPRGQAGGRAQAGGPHRARRRKRRERSGLLKYQDELADLRRDVDPTHARPDQEPAGRGRAGQPRRALADCLQSRRRIRCVYHAPPAPAAASAAARAR